MVNKIIPLLVDTLTLLAKSKVYIQKALYCKLNVLEELRKLTLPFEVKDIIYSEINEKLKHINHLKELGRASFSNPLWMKADAISDEHWKNIKSQHNDSIVFEAMQQAEKLLGISGYFFQNCCPCCGAETFVMYDLNFYKQTNISRVETGKCTLCSYSINVMLGEPSKYKILFNSIFIDPEI
jgi:hypothetical protein